jgi:formyltetrahydrofolate deformylase
MSIDVTPASEFVLTISCLDQRGIVHTVTGYLVERGCDIIESQQYADRRSGRFFMRVHFTTNDHVTTVEELRIAFGPIGRAWTMAWELHDLRVRPRLLVMVSRSGHCLNDLLYRWQAGALAVDIPVIVSNHPDFEGLTAGYGIAFEHVPVTADTKPEAEARLLELAEQHRVDLVVLARYMQVLSGEVCKLFEGRAINIHHSVLPGFKGARPYQQAFDRGVKLVGATAHYVTADLDEGPIIEQEVIRVDHAQSPEELATVGRDAERVALAKAVQWHCERRVLLNGKRTVVFR